MNFKSRMNDFKWRKVIFAVFVLITFEFVCSCVIAQTIRPQVSEDDGWKKDRAHSKTIEQDIKKTMWVKTGEAVSKGRSGPITVVFRSDEKGNAEIWADKSGIHFFDPSTGTVKTPIDLTSFHYLFGPRLNYYISADSTDSFFVVTWWKSKMDKHNGSERVVSGTHYDALLDSSGKVIWKKEYSIALKNKQYIFVGPPSSNGQVLVEVTDDPDDRGRVQIWDSKGNKISDLPGIAHEYSWSDDGERISYKWYSKYPKTKNQKLNSSVFDRSGNWVSGDQQ